MSGTLAMHRPDHCVECQLVQALYDCSRNKLQQKVSQRFLVNRGVPCDILKSIKPRKFGNIVKMRLEYEIIPYSPHVK